MKKKCASSWLFTKMIMQCYKTVHVWCMAYTASSTTAINTVYHISINKDAKIILH
jgi:hypothetical protein